MPVADNELEYSNKAISYGEQMVLMPDSGDMKRSVALDTEPAIFRRMSTIYAGISMTVPCLSNSFSEKYFQPTHPTSEFRPTPSSEKISISGLLSSLGWSNNENGWYLSHRMSPEANSGDMFRWLSHSFPTSTKGGLDESGPSIIRASSNRGSKFVSQNMLAKCSLSA